ncbi:DUF3501 family protein [Paucibacter sp. APW11]|uniref:DUF3501 family protein n=1 Tax=Roseateles aquae TaxID=3077235 RepID=A0ABU3P8W8_9BURK|nr:DUF3501 family protein [Paucibacter sp. APW11]MDT8999016.1 DUF3501 family protein [Paucibacter sp. APW11]
MTITRDSLMTLEAYAKYRKLHQEELLAHRQLRRVQLGEHLSLQFEDEETVRYQIQEMLRLQRIFEEDGINSELDAFAPLVPDGSNWKATLMLEYADPAERRCGLERLLGIEDRVFVEIDGSQRIYAIADEDLSRGSSMKGSAVHFLRFELPSEFRGVLRTEATLRLGCDFQGAVHAVPVSAALLESLIADLKF